MAENDYLQQNPYPHSQEAVPSTSLNSHHPETSNYDHEQTRITDNIMKYL